MDVRRNHLVYTHFAIGGRYLGLVLALECHLWGRGGGLGGFFVISLRSLLLPENLGYKQMQRIAETGFQRGRLTIQGMWMKAEVQLKEELLPGYDSYKNTDRVTNRQHTSFLFLQSLESPKSPPWMLPLKLWLNLMGHTCLGVHCYQRVCLSPVNHRLLENQRYRPPWSWSRTGLRLRSLKMGSS